MSTQQERAEQRRLEKLQQIREQVDKGELTIRRMTKAERKKHPPRPRPAQRRR
jgi:DNA-binding protein H-NS